MGKFWTFKREKGVFPYLISIAEKAVKELDFDIGIPHLGGKRTLEEQKKLLEKGASKTMKSKHLEGLAIDLVAYDGKRFLWTEKEKFFEIENAMKRCDYKGLIDFSWRERNRWDLPHFQMKK